MITVFIIEDDPMVRDINRKFVERIEGFKVIGSVGDIGEAKEYLKDNVPNLVLMDVFLPSGLGVDLLKWMRKKEVESDVIFITAEKNKTSINEAFRYGAVDYLVKPFTFNRLKEAFLKYKERFVLFNIDGEIKQKSIDEHILQIKTNEKNDRRSTSLTKGLNENTYNQIWDYIKNNNGIKLTADQVADEVGVARVTARRYLEFMFKENKLEINQEYGKIGRPTNYYKIKEK
ncbi:response regulator [Clostridium fallax]|uniref:Transcriptional regulatory protein n=1 Tax=Clostridium fallax TaxID=1533 RepID=A0A1M4W429_9CLOT|nr:response regulator [Clostridium fallax]SHE75969.1 two-component system, CitB family, response regulator [Clostridium fallax]SQB22869.1 response regulator of citrate/malate metabolism [Clostridium fallax]